MPRGTFETIYGRIPMNQLANINQNDPWFGLGYLLAQGYNRAYEQRGVDKGIEAGQEIIDNIGNTGDSGMAEAQASAQQEQQQQGGNTLSLEANAIAERNNSYGQQGAAQNAAPASDELYNLARDSGAIAERNNPYAGNDYRERATRAVLGENRVQDNTDSNGAAPQQQGPTREQIKQDTLGYFVNKYSNSPNPDGDAAEARSIATAAEQGLQRINALAGFNKTQTRQQIMDRLIADGRPLSQREAIMEQLDPVLDAKEKSVNDELFNFYNSAYNDRVRAGDYAGAQSLVPRMARYNPQLAAAAVAGVPTIRDMYNEANKEKNAEAQHERDIEMANIRGQNAKALFDYKNQAEFNNRYRGLKALMPELPDETIVGMALTGFNPFSGNGSGSRSGGSGRGGGTSDTTRLNAIKEEIDMYDSWRANNDPNTAYPRQDQLNAATSELSRLYGYDPQAVSANPNYYSIMSGWTDTLKQAQQAALNGEPAPSRAALERVLRQEAGDMADQILNETDWEAFGFGGNSGNNSKGINGGSGRTAGGFR